MDIGQKIGPLDPNFGTEEDLKELVEKTHQNGIRIVLDAVINHTESYYLCRPRIS